MSCKLEGENLLYILLYTTIVYFLICMTLCLVPSTLHSLTSVVDYFILILYFDILTKTTSKVKFK